MQKMERALSIARTQLQRNRIGCNVTPVAAVIVEPPVAAVIVEPLVAAAIVEPPMAYVVEEILEEPFQETSELLLFTVPDNWDPPSDFRVGASLSGPEDYHGGETVVTRGEDFTCYVEEETPTDWTLRKQTPEAALGNNMRRTEEEADLKRTGKENSSEPVEAEPSERSGKAKEDGTIFMPPPISCMQTQWSDPPPLLHPDLLNLVFDLRSQMADHAYRGTLMGQRVDMLFDAYSNVPLGQRCPTCLQHFVIPAKAHALDADTTSDATGY
jgi:hypothetical protein